MHLITDFGLHLLRSGRQEFPGLGVKRCDSVLFRRTPYVEFGGYRWKP